MQLSHLLNGLATVAMALTISSCIEENDKNDEFKIGFNGYILEEGEGENTTFTPYFFFTSNYEQYKIASIDIDGVSNAPDSLIKLKPISDYCYITTGETKVKTPDLMNGKYYMTAKTTTGETCSDIFNIEYEAKEGIDPIILDTLYYDGSSIKAKIREIKGAYVIGFMFGSYNKDSKPQREHYTYFNIVTAPAFYNGTLDITKSFYTTSQLLSDYCEVRVFATTQKSIYRESRAKTLIKDEKLFLEDIK